MPKFNTPYIPRDRVTVSSDLPSMTRQEFRKESDMGTLIQRYTKTGSFYDPLKTQIGTPRAPAYLDCSSIPNFGEIQDKISAAQDDFSRLPSSIRERFENNLTAFVAWIADPSHREEAQKMGLLPSEAVVTIPASSQPASVDGKAATEPSGKAVQPSAAT